MDDYKIFKTVIQDEQLIESLRKFSVDYQIDKDDGVVRIALYELAKEEGYL